jgi:hypothetical protein
MDWRDEIRQIVTWWAGWSILDIAWKWLLGGTALTFLGWLYARYKESALQRELRGAMLGLTLTTIVIMASILASRSVPSG